MTNMRSGTSWVLAFSGLLLAGAGCTESFTATGGSGGGTSSGGGGATTTSSGGATTTSSSSSSTSACMGNETQPCYEGDPKTKGVGVCKAGVNKCVNGEWSATCYGQVLPSTEACDGHDNDCNGKVDEGCSCTDGKTQDCNAGSGTPGVGICKSGTQTCNNGSWGECVGAVGAGDETCANPGADDDCDGTKDNIPNLNTACTTQQPGACSVGTRQCQGGDTLMCVASVMATTETCANQGTDNDCDGVVDNVMGNGEACTISIAQLGLSCDGTKQCAQGGPQAGMQICLPTVVHVQDFANQGNWQTSGEWQIGEAQGSSGQTVGNPDPAMDHSGTNDNKLAGYVIGGNAQNQIHEPEYLTSPNIDTTKLGDQAFLTYFSVLNTNGALVMKDTVEVSTNGGNAWTTIWTNPDVSPVYESGWNLHYLDISAFKSQTFRVRFGVEVVTLGPIVSSWSIDDVGIASCPVGG
ncbi:MAG: hypothetical protein U0441_23985 [Polyangiaceae bacterium]